MTEVSHSCRLDVAGAVERPEALRRYAALADRVGATDHGGRDSIDPGRLITEDATLFLLRDSEGALRAACHTIFDGRGVTHIGGLIQADARGPNPRQCVALAVVYQTALGHQGFRAEYRDGTASARLFADLGFAIFASRAAPSPGAAGGPSMRTRIVNSTQATVPLARGFLSSVIRIV